MNKMITCFKCGCDLVMSVSPNGVLIMDCVNAFCDISYEFTETNTVSDILFEIL